MMGQKQIAMLLSNAFKPDVRVKKEADSLADMGYSVTIICWDRAVELQPREVLPSGVTILRIHSVESGYGLGAQQLRKLPHFWRAILPLLDELQPDLVHAHDFDTLPVGLWWGKRNRRPVIYDAHEYYAELCKPRLHGLTGTLLYWIILLAERLGARLSSAIVTVDERLGAIYRKRNRHVLIIGHYPKRATAQQPSAAFMRDTLRLLYIGRLSEDRGLIVYAKLLRQLLEAGVPTRLCLAGTFTPEAEEDAFLAQSNDLQDNIDYLGFVPTEEVPKLMTSVDVGLALLQPIERFQVALPVKMFEYMASGLPTLVSHFEPIAQIFHQTPFGALIDPQDPEAAAAQIIEWWHNPEQAQMLGETGRQAILETYNWEAIIKPLDTLYRSLSRSQ